MEFYIILYLICLVTSLLEIVAKDKQKLNSLSNILIFSFFVLSFIRWETGTDWESYLGMYKSVGIPFLDIEKDSTEQGVESGFVVINHAAKLLFDSYTGALFISATITYICLYMSINSYSDSPLFCLFVSLCIILGHIFFVRQNIVCCVLLFSIRYIKDKKFWRFVIVILLATLIHKSAFIFIMCYFFWNSEISIKRTLILSLIGCSIMSITVKFLISFLEGFSGVTFYKIAYYFSKGTDDNSTNLSTAAMILKGFANRLFLISLLGYLLNNTSTKDILVRGLFNIYKIGTIIYMILMPLSISMARLAVPFDLVQIFLIPKAISQIQLLSNRVVYFTIIALYLLSRYVANIYMYYEEFVPYKTIFN